MYYLLLVLVFIVCLLLALVVLAQNPKGGGLSSQFGAGGTAQLMGVKRTGDLLEKLTWGFAIALMVLSLGSHMLAGGGGNGPVRSINQQRALETPALPSSPALPGTGATPAPAGAPAQQPATPAPTTPAPAPAAE